MRKFWLLLVVLVPLAVLGLLFGTQAQTPPTVLPDKTVKPVETVKPRDGSKVLEGAQPIFRSAHRAMDWLKRTNKADGRFVYGFQPALCVTLDGDNFVSQAGAAFALARSARYFRDEAGTVKARQAILTLLLETMLDPADATKSIRFTAAPPFALDRLASAGFVISAVHELDHPEKCADLLKQADELCNYLRIQQQSNGSLYVADGTNVVKSGSDEVDAERGGWALQGIIRSQKLRPADWKLDLVRKARSHYEAAWAANKSIAVACSHTPAYAEAYVLTKEPAFKDAVYAMNDWLIGLQYPEDIDAGRKHWVGGFKRLRDGRVEATPPDISSAAAAESLAEACRVAKHAGDLLKVRDYERALLLNVRFLMSMQYTTNNTKHFVDPFVPSVLGAFHASHQDGNLRIDYTRPAVCAMVQYLERVVE
jgi:hypothetical protein